MLASSVHTTVVILVLNNMHEVLRKYVQARRKHTTSTPRYSAPKRVHCDGHKHSVTKHDRTNEYKHIAISLIQSGKLYCRLCNSPLTAVSPQTNRGRSVVLVLAAFIFNSQKIKYWTFSVRHLSRVFTVFDLGTQRTPWPTPAAGIPPPHRRQQYYIYQQGKFLNLAFLQLITVENEHLHQPAFDKL